MCADRPIRGRRRGHVFGVVAVGLSLAAACGDGSSSPTVAAPSAQTSSAPAPSSAPPATNGHCAITSGATAAATVKWNPAVQGRNPTIKAGQAVAFVTAGMERPTVTEGLKGKAVGNPCIDEVLSMNTPVLVTFAKRGVYHFYCRKDPTTMFTAVNVR